jgi:quercetin dioxygenase-like cupin family protein
MSESSFEKSRIYQLKDSVNYSDGAIVSKIITKNNAGNVSLFAFDKGQNLSEHTAPFDAIVQVVEGHGRIIIDGNEYRMQDGDIIIMPANIPHAVEAVERFKMLLTMIKA